MKAIILYKRAAQILTYLINSQTPHTISDLQKIMMVSNRTIRYDLDLIDDFLIFHKLSKLDRKPRVGVHFSGTETERKRVAELLESINEYNYVLSPDERIKLIILEFVEADNYVTIESLSDKLMVSRSTINKDLKAVRQILEKHDISLNPVFGQGLKLEGKEKNIRNILSEMWLEYVYRAQDVGKDKSRLKRENFRYRRLVSRLKQRIDIPFVENCANIMESELGIGYSDVAYANIVANMCITINRLKRGNRITLTEQEKEKLRGTKEFNVVRNFVEIIEDYFSIKMCEDEIAYIATHFLGGNLSEIDKDTQGEWIYLQLIVKKIIQEVNKKIAVDIIHDKKLFTSLLKHIDPMIYRLKYGIRLENPMLKNIQDNYKYLFEIVKESIEPIENYASAKLNDEEIGFLTIHFGAAIEREKAATFSKPKVLIVCNAGVSTSELISVQIQSMFDVDIVGKISYRQLDRYVTDDVDVIISTVPINKDINIKSINVSPILTDENFQLLNKMFLKSKKSKIEIRGLIKVIEQSCEIKNYQKLEKDLYNILNIGVIKELDGDEGPMLMDLITEDTIDLNVEANTWEEAVRKGGELLIKHEAIENRYIDAMINSVKEIGPYIVIAEGIAMPHARPEDGALKVAMSLITLQKPIEFGNADHDPVKLVISFCSIDSKTHLRALSELMVLLENEEYISRIIDAKSKGEVIKVIEECSK